VRHRERRFERERFVLGVLMRLTTALASELWRFTRLLDGSWAIERLLAGSLTRGGTNVDPAHAFGDVGECVPLNGTYSPIVTMGVTGSTLIPLVMTDACTNRTASA
jgi:hypothetical protein